MCNFSPGLAFGHLLFEFELGSVLQATLACHAMPATVSAWISYIND
jgi:hypothetical protein